MGDPNWVIATFTIVTAIAAVVTWRTYRRIEWLTGSMDSLQGKMLRLQVEAFNEGKPEEKQIKLIWWDPSKAPWPIEVHDAAVDNRTMYIGVRRAQRQMHPTLWSDLRVWASDTWRYVVPL